MTPAKLRSIRAALNLTQREFATELGISDRWLSQLERGKRSDTGEPVSIPRSIELAARGLQRMACAEDGHPCMVMVRDVESGNVLRRATTTAPGDALHIAAVWAREYADDAPEWHGPEAWSANGDWQPIGGYDCPTGPDHAGGAVVIAYAHRLSAQQEPPRTPV